MLPRVTARDTFDDVQRVRARRPPHAGSYWAKLSFKDLLASVRANVADYGWRPSEWTAHLFRSGQDVTASIVLAGYPITQPGVAASIGVAASNAARRRTALYVGTTIPAAGSAVVHAAIVAEHRHTHNYSIADEVTAMLGECTEALAALDDDIAKLKKKRLGAEAATRLTHAAGRANLMPWSRVGRVETLWTAGGDRSAWALLKIFGSVSDLNTPAKHLDRLYNFYRLVSGGTPVRVH